MSSSESIERSSRGLTKAMFDEMDLLVQGKSTPQQARAKASIVNTICAVNRLEMDFARFVASERSGSAASLKDRQLASLRME